MKNTKHFVAVIILVILATVGLRLLFSFMFQLPTPASEEAIPIDIMFNVHFWLIAFLFGLIMVIMLYSALVFRRQPGDEEDAPHIHGNATLEIVWTVLPTITVIGFGVWAVGVLQDLVKPEPNEMVVHVTGRQWSWSFEYPEDDNARSSQLTLPVNRPVLLEMEAEDVLHSFWVPEFRVKQDLVPGQVTHLRFTPTEVGSYTLRCAEICGTSHAYMLAQVNIVSDSEFAAFIEDAKDNPAQYELAEERGAAWSSNEYLGCAACHSIDGSALAGPTWLNIMGRQEQMDDGTTITVDEAYLRESILNPNAHIVAGYNANVMPQNFDERIATLEADLGAQDIIGDLIAYMATLQE
ncbi:MAG: cytochrome c oxidase subunit II [Ardenticatenaceae bacterium]|nr:cytochrome c oxidase subunit II [Ardenticatenaceae bacterium]